MAEQTQSPKETEITIDPLDINPAVMEAGFHLVREKMGIPINTMGDYVRFLLTNARYYSEAIKAGAKEDFHPLDEAEPVSSAATGTTSQNVDTLIRVNLPVGVVAELEAQFYTIGIAMDFSQTMLEGWAQDHHDALQFIDMKKEFPFVTSLEFETPPVGFANN